MGFGLGLGVFDFWVVFAGWVGLMVCFGGFGFGVLGFVLSVGFAVCCFFGVL